MTPEEKKEMKDEYIRISTILINSIDKKSEIFDHWLLTGSLGSFGLSFLFLKDLGTSGIGFLVAGWYLFGLSAMLMLVTYYFTIQHDLKKQEYVNETFTTSGFLHNIKLFGHEFKKIDSTKTVIRINELALMLFMLGIVSSMVFATKNVVAQKKIKDSNSTQSKQTTFIQYNNYYYQQQN